MTQRTTPEIHGADRETGLPCQYNSTSKENSGRGIFFSSARLIEEEMKNKFVCESR